jgi:hypothetical protein
MDINIPPCESPIPLLEYGRGSVTNLDIADRKLLIGYPHLEGAAKRGLPVVCEMQTTDLPVNCDVGHEAPGSNEVHIKIERMPVYAKHSLPIFCENPAMPGLGL